MSTQVSIKKVLHPTYGIGEVVDNSLWGSLKVRFGDEVKQVATARVTFLFPDLQNYITLLEEELTRVKKQGTIRDSIYSKLRMYSKIRGDKDVKDIA